MATTFTQSRNDSFHFPEEKKKNDLTVRGRAANHILSDSKPLPLTTAQHCCWRGVGSIKNQPKPPCDKVTTMALIPVRLATAGAQRSWALPQEASPNQAPSIHAKASEGDLTKGGPRAERCKGIRSLSLPGGRKAFEYHFYLLGTEVKSVVCFQ